MKKVYATPVGGDMLTMFQNITKNILCKTKHFLLTLLLFPLSLQTFQQKFNTNWFRTIVDRHGKDGFITYSTAVMGIHKVGCYVSESQNHCETDRDKDINK